MSSNEVENFITSKNILEIGKKFALLVGINVYDDTSYNNLRYSINDINKFREILLDKDRGKYDENNVYIMKDNSEELPMRNSILSKLVQISRTVTSEDSLIFYFSGHGFVKDEESYIICKDTYNNTLEETAIKIKLIKDIMGKSLARVKIIILDACHSGAIKGVKDSGIMSKTFYESLFPVPEGFVILSSCKINEYSYEWDEKEQGVFSYYFIEGLKGNADKDINNIITISSVHKYTFNNVSKWAFIRNKEQNPTLEAKISGDIPLVYSIDISKEEIGFDINIIKDITLISIDYDLNSEIISITQEMLGQLLNYYKFEDIKGIDDNNYTYTDGEIDIKKIGSPEKYYNLFQFNINKTNINIFNQLMQILDTNYSWEIITYTCNHKIDLSKLNTKCKENSFTIIKYNPTKDKQLLTVKTEGWLNTITTFTNEKDQSTISIRNNVKILPKNFYNLLNINNIRDFIKDILI